MPTAVPNAVSEPAPASTPLEPPTAASMARAGGRRRDRLASLMQERMPHFVRAAREPREAEANGFVVRRVRQRFVHHLAIVSDNLCDNFFFPKR